MYGRNGTVRTLAEDLADLGLDANKVVGAVNDTHRAMVEGIALDPTGRPAGDASPRSYAEFGRTLLSESHNGGEPLTEKMWIKGAVKHPGRLRKALGVKEGEDISIAQVDGLIKKLSSKAKRSKDETSLLRAAILGKRLLLKSKKGKSLKTKVEDAIRARHADTVQEASFGLKRKPRGVEAMRARRKRALEYIKNRQTVKTQGKVFRATHKPRLRMLQKQKMARFGASGLARAHKAGFRVVQKRTEWDERLDALKATLGMAIVESKVQEMDQQPINHYAEAAFRIAVVAQYLGEIFDASGDPAGKQLMTLSTVAEELAQKITGEPTEEQEQTILRFIDGISAAMQVWEDAEFPSLLDSIEEGKCKGKGGKGKGKKDQEPTQPVAEAQEQSAISDIESFAGVLMSQAKDIAMATTSGNIRRVARHTVGLIRSVAQFAEMVDKTGKDVIGDSMRMELKMASKDAIESLKRVVSGVAEEKATPDSPATGVI